MRNLGFTVWSLVLVGAGLVGGCVGDSPVGSGVDSGSTPDAATTPDASGADASVADTGSDTSSATDSGDAASDAAPPVDAVSDAPLPLVSFPTHASSAAILPNAGDLTDPVIIDTDATTVQLVANGPSVLPSGATFTKGVDRSVLAVGAVSIGKALVVKGKLALVVVASKGVSISAAITARGIGTVPGPGALTSGGGTGGLGISTTKGGGGGGFGDLGAAGGGVGGGLAGTTFNPLLTDLSGGAPGGNGSGPAGTCGGFSGLGGGGGGAVVISSVVSIMVNANGSIHVGGGGGAAGCNGNSAPGGGSGGLAFLEAPTITMNGFIAANGGGGGGGPSDVSNGIVGSDATLSTTPAAGGPSASGSGSGKGGNGAAGATVPTVGQAATSSGGGGGGLGRIRLRYRNVPTLGGTFSGTKQEYSNL